MTAPNTLPHPWSKAAREHVAALVLPLLAIASVLAAHAAYAGWTQARAPACPAAHATALTVQACRQG